jgi:dephospho-CoA kinase
VKPLVLGVTGGIGSGKSAVSRLLADYCLAPLIDIDRACRHLLQIDQPGWRGLRQLLAPSFFLDDGEVDRALLRECLFQDAALRQQVDSLLHPLARSVLRESLAAVNGALVLVEVPLLYEAGWESEVDRVLVVYARRGVRCRRIVDRDGCSQRSAVRAMAAQMPLAEKVCRADYCIDNSGPWTSTRKAVIMLGDTLPVA